MPSLMNNTLPERSRGEGDSKHLCTFLNLCFIFIFKKLLSGAELETDFDIVHIIDVCIYFCPAL